jgi:hypothetical protein
MFQMKSSKTVELWWANESGIGLSRQVEIHENIMRSPASVDPGMRHHGGHLREKGTISVRLQECTEIAAKHDRVRLWNDDFDEAAYFGDCLTLCANVEFC